MKSEYTAYKNGNSIVLAAPGESADQKFIRDKVHSVITYTPIELSKTKLSELAGIVTARKYKNGSLLAVWPEYRGKKFTRKIKQNGIIEYREVKE